LSSKVVIALNVGLVVGIGIGFAWAGPVTRQINADFLGFPASRLPTAGRAVVMEMV
jgi:hypothetical protein